MKQRDNVIGRKMVRKSKHGSKVSRWGTHQEIKQHRSKWSKGV